MTNDTKPDRLSGLLSELRSVLEPHTRPDLRGPDAVQVKPGCGEMFWNILAELAAMPEEIESQNPCSAPGYTGTAGGTDAGQRPSKQSPLSAFVHSPPEERERMAAGLADAACERQAPSTRRMEHLLAEAGVFAGHSGLRGLLDSGEFWDKQPYGTRLYYGAGNQYLHRSILRTAVELLDKFAAAGAPSAQEPHGEVVITTNEAGQCVAVTRQDEEGRILKVIWELGSYEDLRRAPSAEPVDWIDAADRFLSEAPEANVFDAFAAGCRYVASKAHPPASPPAVSKGAAEGQAGSVAWSFRLKTEASIGCEAPRHVTWLPREAVETPDTFDWQPLYTHPAATVDERLMEAATALRDYLTSMMLHGFDVPDEIWMPFCAALTRHHVRRLRSVQVDERKEFEAYIHRHAARSNLHLYKGISGEYVDPDIQHDWCVWQARAALAGKGQG